MNRLVLEPEPTAHDWDNDNGPVMPLHFYESSLRDSATDEPLLSCATRGRGMRITRDQARELHAYLGEWLAA